MRKFRTIKHRKEDMPNGMVRHSVDFDLPEFHTIAGEKWTKYGKDNQYPYYLIDIADASPKHGAVLKKKAELVSGRGFELEPQAVSKIGGGKTQQIINLLEQANGYEETLTDLLEKCAADFEIFNGFAIHVIYDLVGNMKELHHLPFQHVRTNDTKTKFWYNPDWSGYTSEYKEFMPFRRDASHPNGGANDAKEELFYYTKYTAGMMHQHVYPKPEYMAALKDCEVDAEISMFSLGLVLNGFTGGTMIVFNGQTPGEDEKREIEKQINENFSGSGNANGIIMYWAANMEAKPDIIPLRSNDLDKQYHTLSERVKGNIFIGHGVPSPMLFGDKTEGQLGGRDEMYTAYALWQDSYINSRQQHIERAFNKLLGVAWAQPLKIKHSELVERGKKLQEANITGNMPAAPDAQGGTPQGSQSGPGRGLPDLEGPCLKWSKDGSKCLKRGETIRQAAHYICCSSHASPMTEAEQRIVEALKVTGHSADEFTTRRARPVVDGAHYFAEAVIGEVTKLEASILQLLQQNNKLSSAEIAEVLKAELKAVDEAMKALKNDGYIGESQQVTESGEKAVQELADEGAIIELSLMYRYALAPWAQGPVLLETSRQFCVDVVNMNKLYTRQQLEEISAAEGRNVWLFRGGFYTNPDTGETTPYCRHIWEQVVVQKVTKK